MSDRVAEIRARHAAATKGNWYADRRPRFHEANAQRDVGRYANVIATEGVCCVESVVAQHSTAVDADFIAHAPGDIEFLLAENDRLRGPASETLEWVDHSDRGHADGLLVAKCADAELAVWTNGTGWSARVRWAPRTFYDHHDLRSQEAAQSACVEMLRALRRVVAPL